MVELCNGAEGHGCDDGAWHMGAERHGSDDGVRHTRADHRGAHT